MRTTIATAGPVVLALLAVLAVAGCRFGEPAEDRQLTPPRFDPPGPTLPSPAAPQLTEVHEVIVSDLDLPWDLDFLPDGGALVTERASGRILQVGPESDRDGLRVEEVQTIEVDPAGEGGLLGIAVSPDYPTDGWIFAYHSTASDNRIVRFTLGGEPEPILTGIPHAPAHNGGRLAFSPHDGYLYATTGDAGTPDRAQDPADLAGAILRLTADGAPAPDNPFDNHVYAYGLRNPEGLAWDEAGRLWATDLGQDGADELNLVEPGANYGWPTCEGRCYPAEPDLVDPVVAWEPAEAACSGTAVVGRSLVAACLRGQRLWVTEVTDSGAVLGAPRPLLVDVYGRLRAVTVAPDGSLWVTTSNRDGRLPGAAHDRDDRIIRLVVSGAGGAGQL